MRKSDGNSPDALKVKELHRILPFLRGGRQLLEQPFRVLCQEKASAAGGTGKHIVKQTTAERTLTELLPLPAYLYDFFVMEDIDLPMSVVVRLQEIFAFVEVTDKELDQLSIKVAEGKFSYVPNALKSISAKRRMVEAVLEDPQLHPLLEAPCKDILRRVVRLQSRAETLRRSDSQKEAAAQRVRVLRQNNRHALLHHDPQPVMMGLVGSLVHKGGGKDVLAPMRSILDIFTVHSETTYSVLVAPRFVCDWIQAEVVRGGALSPSSCWDKLYIDVIPIAGQEHLAETAAGLWAPHDGSSAFRSLFEALDAAGRV